MREGEFSAAGARMAIAMRSRAGLGVCERGEGEHGLLHGDTTACTRAPRPR